MIEIMMKVDVTISLVVTSVYFSESQADKNDSSP